MDSRNKGSLASMDFRLIIIDGVGTDGARTQDEATEYHGIIQGCLARGDPAIEESLANKKNTTGTTNLRVRRLLEPLRQLHSIHSPQIIGPLSEEYKAEVIADITKTMPSDQELFDHVLTTSEKAINNPDSGDSASSILDLKNTLVELGVAKRLIKDIYTELITGPYAGVTMWEAYEDIEFLLSTKLAWAYLKTGDVRTAHRWLCLIIRSVVDSRRECWKAKPGGHKIAMFFYLKSQVLEGWDRISGHDRACHCYCLPETVKALRQGLRHEPGNRVLAQELEKKELELAKEKEIDDLINMAYRLGFESNLEILEDHWYIPGWIWNQKG